MREVLSLMRRGIDDYRMIEEGDRIAVGVSGGKDSLALLAVMRNLQLFQLSEQPIVLKIGHLRIVQNIIAIIRIIQQLCQLQNSLFGVHINLPCQKRYRAPALQ